MNWNQEDLEPAVVSDVRSGFRPAFDKAEEVFLRPGIYPPGYPGGVFKVGLDVFGV